MLGAVIVLLSSTTSAGRGRRFKGPQVQGGDAELTEIEREFQHAAEDLKTT